MKISYNWLKEYLATSLTPERIGEILTSTGLEVESVEKVEKVKGGLKGVVVGHVVDCIPHPDADRLRLTRVDVGTGDALQIVCGAPNVASGQKVLVATIGTTLYPNNGDPLTIKKGKIRGQESHGMICAEDELGLGTNHDGILVLRQDAQVGTLAAEELGLTDDVCLEIGLTPNRTDAFSHFGVARDLYAALRNTYTSDQQNVQLFKPSVQHFQKDEDANAIRVSVEHFDACPLYCGVVVSGVKVGPSPKWMADRLIAIGLRPINNIVDITNYVQFEIGQPLHAFDINKIEGKEIVVRKAYSNELIKTLDGVERKLHKDDLVICDQQKPMCIAGVYGGIDSGVTEKSTDIFLESAWFNPVFVRKTGRRHGLHTDSSFRFERGCDPEQTTWALKRAALLIKELASGKISSPIIEIKDPRSDIGIRKNVQYHWKKSAQFIGTEIPSEKVINILNDLDFSVKNSDENTLVLEVPTSRGEVTREADVVEEILRIYGYDNVPFPQGLKTSLSNTQKPDKEKTQQTISDYLASIGFLEMMGMSLTRQKYLSLSSSPDEEDTTVQLLNPLSSDLAVLRKNLMYGALETVALNQNHKNSDLRLFEFGKTYSKKEKTYTETNHFSIVLCGKKYPENWNNSKDEVSFADLNNIIQNILKLVGIEGLQSNSSASGNFSDGIELSRGNKKLLSAGLVHPNLLKAFDIDRQVIYADVDWDVLISLIPKNRYSYSPPDKYPAVRRDLSLLLNQNVSFSEIEALAFSSDKTILRSIGLFDVYEGKNLPMGKKSYAISFVLQDKNKTLKDEQVDHVMNKVTRTLQEKLGAELRS